MRRESRPSYVAAAALLSTILDRVTLRERIVAQLEACERESDWLEYALDGIRRTDGYKEEASGQDYEPIRPEFAVAISWLLGRARLSDITNEEFTEALRSSVSRECQGIALHAAVQERSQLTVLSWTVGVVVGKAHRHFPCAFPVGYLDVDVQAAYDGLVEHVDSISVSNRVHEMAISSVLWRFGAIAEGLKNPDDDLTNAIEKLAQQAAPVGEEPGALKLVLRHSWARSFVPKRNALTHVREDRGMRFATVVSDLKEVDAARDSIELATRFIASEIARNLDNTTDVNVVSSLLDRVEDEWRWILA